jgi:hypothetical protein
MPLDEIQSVILDHIVAASIGRPGDIPWASGGGVNRPSRGHPLGEREPWASGTRPEIYIGEATGASYR